MLTELTTAVLVLGLPVLLLIEEIVRLRAVGVKLERTRPSRQPQLPATAARQTARVV
jgi:hypothetical protein